MAIKIYKPTTPGRRQTSVIKVKYLDKVKPYKQLLIAKKNMAGRTNTGNITVRHQGGGEKNMIRQIDFKRDRFDIPAKVVSLEYDPNRNAHIALVMYADGERRYIIAPEGLRQGMTVISSKKEFQPQLGNCFPLGLIPPGTMVHNVELVPGKGGVLGRAAGNGLTIQVIEGDYAQVKMPSSEVRLIPKTCLATVGQVSNIDFRNIRWGKAGRMRHRGIRPTVRGKVMNPVDHPHGGGEGHNPVGLKRGPMNIYGKKALGVKTRNTHKFSGKLIISRRKGRVN
ncbi:MAG: 50S ribosomal protein L2 [Candidatus Komeilibacteria bacterium]|nr:50S ribosomal protein L2 [Candidatus Komeilibacteria bacterium]